MDRPIRVGVIGAGSVSGVYIPHLRRLNEPNRQRVEVAMACDNDERRRAEVKERFGLDGDHFTTDAREVIESPDIDLVLVLTAMPEHGRLATAALAAGKHVLVEKPMAMTLEEAADLVDLARRSPGYLVCAPHVVLSPTYQAMWKRVHRGDIGRVYSARGFYGWSGPTWGPWYYAAGGGSLFDLGVYNVTTLTGLLGPAKRVMAMSGVAIPERVIDRERTVVESDDNVQLLLDFGETTYAVVTTGFTIQRYRNAGIELYGSEGTIQMIGEDWAPRGYELWQNREGCWRTYEA
jgi:predicted dehydrogenase